MLCPRCNFDAPPGLRYCPACSNDLAALQQAPASPYPAPGYPSGAYPQVPMAPSGSYPQVPFPPSGSYPQVPLGYPQVSAIPMSAPPRPPQQRRSLLLVLVALGIVAILGLGAVAVLHFTDKRSVADPGPSRTHTGAATPTGSDTPTSAAASSPADPQALARTQASAVDSLLVTAMASRATLTTALNEADSCVNWSDARGKLTQVVNDRTLQVQLASQLEVSALDQGTQLRQDLVTAWQWSLQADQSYLAWVNWMIRNNRCQHNSDQASAAAYSEQSHAPKDQFLALWNPIASRFGLPQRTRENV